ncbi:MAG: YibE/F family protein, partial [Clostridiales bacterium]|nr:YibE/F family protein [Clostridiales bacterium]
MEKIRKHVASYLIAALAAAILAVWVYGLNQVTKTQLVNRTGQSFETGVVTEILQDNVQENGTRVGQQTVLVHMTSGEKRGEDLVTTSSSGYLFGAACVVGMKVVVIQSIAGETVVSAVYSADRTAVVIGFAALYLAALALVGGWQGIKGALGLIFTFVAILFIYLPMVYLGYSPFWTAVLICVLTTIATMCLIGGATRKTLCATAGTIVGVMIAGITATVFSHMSGITGWNVSDIESLFT